jgi:hypothetical protein
MALSSTVKTGLDETRTLILCAQILLGFQLRGAFEQRFDGLPAAAKTTSGAALCLMLLSIGLLIVPSAFHRIADHGESTGRTRLITGHCAAAALLPFAFALGLDLMIASGIALDSVAVGIGAGAWLALMALIAWYGVAQFMKRRQGAAERGKAEAQRDASEMPPLHVRIEQMLTEARVILPGAQALLGFQLAIVLTEVFPKLPVTARVVHGVALLFVAFAIVLLTTPPAIHRIVWAGEDTEAMLKMGGRITISALLPLAVGMSGDAYVVFARMSGSPMTAAVMAPMVLLILLGMWFGWPIFERWQRLSSGNDSVHVAGAER